MLQTPHPGQQINEVSAWTCCLQGQQQKKCPGASGDQRSAEDTSGRWMLPDMEQSSS